LPRLAFKRFRYKALPVSLPSLSSQFFAMLRFRFERNNGYDAFHFGSFLSQWEGRLGGWRQQRVGVGYGFCLGSGWRLYLYRRSWTGGIMLDVASLIHQGKGNS
jgi:hypothetical protein